MSDGPIRVESVEHPPTHVYHAAWYMFKVLKWDPQTGPMPLHKQLKYDRFIKAFHKIQA